MTIISRAAPSDAAPPRAGKRRTSILGRFAANRDGGATIEFTLWLPLFCLLLIMTADLSMLLLKHANMWDVARDAARRMALYEMTSDEAEAHVASRLSGQSESLHVRADDGDELIVLITMPTDDVVPFGVFSAAMDGTVIARVSMLKEPI